MNEYKTLEQQIQELWKSRDMEIESIQFSTESEKGKEKGIWIIKASSIS